MTLELTTTEALITELKRRYPLLLLIASADHDAQTATGLMTFHGNLLSLIGLAEVARHELLEEYQENMEPTSDTP